MTLSHNLIVHPIAGLLWALSDKLQALGDRFHDPRSSRSEERWLAEFNLVWYGRGGWSASDVARMSDDQLIYALTALHNAWSAELEAAKREAEKHTLVVLDGAEVSKNQSKHGSLGQSPPLTPQAKSRSVFHKWSYTNPESEFNGNG